MALTHQNLRGIRVPGWEDINFQELAKRSGFHPQHLRQALSGRQHCSTAVLAKVADALDLTMGELVVKIDIARRRDRARLALK